MAKTLKVFRTAVGFRDAYVAAPSQAAALRAWGTDKNLFARGAAEVVTEPELTREPLSKPGQVVYRTRGSLKEQIAALGDLPRRKAKPAPAGNAAPSATKRKRAPAPRPSRKALQAAEEALAQLEREQANAEAELRRRERELAAERKAMEARFAKDLARCRERVQSARNAYDEALRAWEP